MYGKFARLPYDQRRRARMDSQATAAKRRRAKVRDLKIPTRRDFGTAAFDLIVAMFLDMPGAALPEALRKNLCGNLVRDGFDPDETRIRFYAATETLAAVVADRRRRPEFEARQRKKDDGVASSNGGTG